MGYGQTNCQIRREIEDADRIVASERGKGEPREKKAWKLSWQREDRRGVSEKKFLRFSRGKTWTAAASLPSFFLAQRRPE